MTNPELQDAIQKLAVAVQRLRRNLNSHAIYSPDEDITLALESTVALLQHLTKTEVKTNAS